jgi:hypothetical protein
MARGCVLANVCLFVRCMCVGLHSCFVFALFVDGFGPRRAGAGDGHEGSATLRAAMLRASSCLGGADDVSFSAAFAPDVADVTAHLRRALSRRYCAFAALGSDGGTLCSPFEQLWSDKYRPCVAVDVLGNAGTAVALRDAVRGWRRRDGGGSEAGSDDEYGAEALVLAEDGEQRVARGNGAWMLVGPVRGACVRAVGGIVAYVRVCVCARVCACVFVCVCVVTLVC